MQYFHSDPAGSIVTVTDPAGSPIASLTYRAFGTPRQISGAMPAFAFAGRPYHPETGLVSFAFRDYDPASGRFLQTEPLGLFAGWESAYAYAMNNPVNFIDPYGLWPSISQVVGGAVIAAGVIAAGVAVVAAAPVIAAGGTIGAGIAAAGAALAPVGAAAGAAATWLGPVGTAAAVAGGAGGAVVSAATAATHG